MGSFNKEEFKGRIAVVTGGSEGIGFDICNSLCQLGCEVYFCARNVLHGESASKKAGLKAHYFQVDVACPEQINHFSSYVASETGRVDYLINNAAIDDRIKFIDVESEVCDKMWQVNLRSYLLITRAFLDLLLAGKGKSVVNIGTTNYMLGLAPFTVYNATKSGILGFTRSLAREVGSEGIRANMVSPGWIMTEKQLCEYVTEEDKEGLLRDQSLKFLLEAHHVTKVVLFLLSSMSEAITGQNLVVNGGKFMY